MAVSTTTPTAEQVAVPETLLKKRRSTEKSREEKLAAAAEAQKVSLVSEGDSLRAQRVSVSEGDLSFERSETISSRAKRARFASPASLFASFASISGRALRASPPERSEVSLFSLREQSELCLRALRASSRASRAYPGEQSELCLRALRASSPSAARLLSSALLFRAQRGHSSGVTASRARIRHLVEAEREDRHSSIASIDLF